MLSERSTLTVNRPAHTAPSCSAAGVTVGSAAQLVDQLMLATQLQRSRSE